MIWWHGAWFDCRLKGLRPGLNIAASWPQRHREIEVIPDDNRVIVSGPPHITAVLRFTRDLQLYLSWNLSGRWAVPAWFGGRLVVDLMRRA